MSDVEEYNRRTVEKGYSASQVAKRLQLVKALVDLAGRPENGMQRLAWNWDSREVFHGKPTKAKKLPTVTQLKKLLRASDARGRAMIWLGIGLGFGQTDLAEVRVGQIDEESYDLRRGKTGIERYGKTPNGLDTVSTIEYWTALPHRSLSPVSGQTRASMGRGARREGTVHGPDDT